MNLIRRNLLGLSSINFEAAAYGVQTIVENETANELASDSVDVLKAWMKKAKTELEQSTEGGR